MMEHPDESESLEVEALVRVASDPERVEAVHRLLGEFFHLIRNRLNGLQISLYLAKQSQSAGERSRWEDSDRLYREAERVIDQFQTVCRPMKLCPVQIGLDLVLREFGSRWIAELARRGLTLEVHAPDPELRTDLDPTRWRQGLDGLASWRAERAAPGTRIVLRGCSGGGRSRIEWIESSPGEQDRVAPGGALPLAVLARVAAAHGGRLLRSDSRAGLTVEIEWPAILDHVAAESPDVVLALAGR